MKNGLPFLLVTIIIFMLTACGSKFICDYCEEESSGKSYSITMLGEKMTICEECKEDFDEFLSD